MIDEFQEQLRFMASKCGFAVDEKTKFCKVPADVHKWDIPIPPPALARVSPPVDMYPVINCETELVELDWKVMLDGWGTYKIGFGQKSNTLIYTRSEINLTIR